VVENLGKEVAEDAGLSDWAGVLGVWSFLWLGWVAVLVLG
jgi:hypothetical protein